MSRKDREELEAHRNFQYRLAKSASEHSVLGDDFAVIVSGMLDEHRQALPKGRG